MTSSDHDPKRRNSLVTVLIAVLVILIVLWIVFGRAAPEQTESPINPELADPQAVMPAPEDMTENAAPVELPAEVLPESGVSPSPQPLPATDGGGR